MQIHVEGRKVLVGQTNDLFDLVQSESPEFVRAVLTKLHEERKRIYGRCPEADVLDNSLRVLRHAVAMH